MRDYVLSEALSREAFGLAAVVARVVRNWKHQRELQALLHAEEHMLKDLGLTRGMIRHLLSQSLFVDLDWERERLLRQR